MLVFFALFLIILKVVGLGLLLIIPDIFLGCKFEVVLTALTSVQPAVHLALLLCVVGRALNAVRRTVLTVFTFSLLCNSIDLVNLLLSVLPRELVGLLLDLE